MTVEQGDIFIQPEDAYKGIVLAHRLGLEGRLAITRGLVFRREKPVDSFHLGKAMIDQSPDFDALALGHDFDVERSQESGRHTATPELYLWKRDDELTGMLQTPIEGEAQNV